MKRFPGIVAAIALMLGLACVLGHGGALAAADATGTWSAQMQTPNGDMTITFHFKQDGAKLTGTVDSPMGGDPSPIANGKIDGEKIYWETSFNGATMIHEGKISGDEIKVSVKSSDGNFPGMDITLKRAKD